MTEVVSDNGIVKRPQKDSLVSSHINEELARTGEEPPSAEPLAVGSGVKDGWGLLPTNRKAVIAENCALIAYRYSLITVWCVVALRIGDLLGWFDMVKPQVQFGILGLNLLITLGFGLTALFLSTSNKVAHRGDKFVKKIVRMSLYAIFLSNILAFLLLFSVFEWPDLSSF